MATRYVRGQTGLDTNTGADWDNAKQSVLGALTIATNNDIIVVDASEVYTYSTSGNYTWLPAAGATNLAIISVARSGTTGFTRQAGAKETLISPAANFVIRGIDGSRIYIDGMILENNDAGYMDLLVNDSIRSMSLTMVSCTLAILTNLQARYITFGYNAGSACRGIDISLLNCTITTGSRLGYIFNILNAFVDIKGCTFNFTGANKPVHLFDGGTSTVHSVLTMQDCDISSTGSALIRLDNLGRGRFLFKNIRLANVSPTTGSWPSVPGNASITIRNCSYGDTLDTFRYMTAFGEVTTVDATTDNVYMVGGAQYNYQSVSWHVTTTALASEWHPFVCPAIGLWSDNIGDWVARIRLTCNSSLTSSDVWSEMSYPVSTTAPYYQIAGGRSISAFVGGAGALTTSSVTWNNSLTYRQDLGSSQTLVEIGLLQALVYVNKPSADLYLNPVINLT